MRRLFCFAPLLLLAAGAAHADKYSDTVTLFKNAGDSSGFFRTSYAYAVFPTVGEAGFILGGAHGNARGRKSPRAETQSPSHEYSGGSPHISCPLSLRCVVSPAESPGGGEGVGTLRPRAAGRRWARSHRASLGGRQRPACTTAKPPVRKKPRAGAEEPADPAPTVARPRSRNSLLGRGFSACSRVLSTKN